MSQPPLRPARPLRSAIVATVAAVALLGSAAPSLVPQGGAAAELDAFIADFLATGDEEGIPELAAAAFHRRLDEVNARLDDLRAIDREALDVQDEIDWRFAHSILMGEKIELEEIRPWTRDPRNYMRFRSLGLAVERPGDPEARAEELMRRLEAVPGQLANGRRNLEVHVPRFAELALFMAQGARGLFRDDIPDFAESVPAQRGRILAAATAAADALESWIGFLRDELPERPEESFAIGSAAYDRMLEHQYLLSRDGDALHAFAREQFDATVAELEEVARAIDPERSWRELAVEIKNDYPEPSRMIEAHQEWVDAARDHVLGHDLIPIPWEERVDVVPRAEYLRKTSYYGNFSRAREPNEEGVWVAQWQINPFEDQWSAEQKREYLVEHDWGVIIVTAPHETYGGHHVQLLYQAHNPRPLRRRHGISIFTEGWGLYNEQLMQETGFFPDERIHLRQLQLRLWRNARVVYDSGMHTGNMSYDEAVSLLVDGVGFLPWAAELEIDAAAQRPGYFIGYFLGMHEILRLRDEYRRRRGDEFTLRDFHERLLQVGSMPPALMRAGLMATLE